MDSVAFSMKDMEDMEEIYDKLLFELPLKKVCNDRIVYAWNLRFFVA